MKTIYFEDALDFAVSVDSMYENVLNKADFADISIIAKYKEANEIIKSLINIGEYDIYSFNNFINPNHSPEEYSDEYIIGIMNSELYVEPFKQDDDYMGDESKYIYVLSNCSSKVLSHLESDNIYEVVIGEEDCDCENCKLYYEPISSTSTTTYSINDKAVSKEEYEDKMAELDVAFRKHIDTILDDYSDFVNEMNNWRKLFEW